MAFHYIKLANQLERQISNGEYRAGEKLPSLRKLREITGRSISTVYQAYEELENRGLIEVREKSGFFVRPLLGNILPLPKQGVCPVKPHKVAINVLSSLIQRSLDNPDLIPFGEAIAAQSLLPGKQIAAAVRTAAAGYQDGSSGVYGASIGDEKLRRELGKRSADIEQQPCGGEIIITHGCMNGIELCLRSVAKSGDMILLESPTFLCYHQLIEDLNMRAIEIPTDPVLGLDLNKIEQTLEEHDVRAALFNPTFQNPLGFDMTASAKEALVTLFAERGIPIIEDDVYGDLYFGESRSRPLKSFDRQGMVLYCSSFSKALLPDLRLGWTIAGKFREKVKRLKFNNSVACSQLMQRALYLYLKSGNYERHLRKLRNSLRKQAADMGQAVARYFPECTRISSPKGGLSLWVEMSSSVDSLELFHLAENENIAIMPGTLCSVTGQYNHCIRLCFGTPWNERLEKGMETLGKLVHSLTIADGVLGEQENGEEIVIGLNTDPDFLKIEGIVASPLLQQSRFGIRFQQSMSGNIVKLVATGELHGGFVFGECDHELFAVQALATYPLCIVGPIQMAEKILNAKYKDLAELPWIGNPVGCPYSQVMNDIFYERGLQPRSVVTVSDESGIVSMLKAGVGLNFMLETDARKLADEGVLVIWEQERFPQALSFVTLRGEREDVGRELLREVIAEIW